MKKLNWNNLKSYKCPVDGKALKERKPHHVCIECPFTISEEKFSSIISQKYTPKRFNSEEDNLSELNNLGRKEVGDSFLD